MLMQGFARQLRAQQMAQNDLKHSNICQPGEKSRSSNIQLRPPIEIRGSTQPAHRARDAASARKMSLDPTIVLNLAAMRLISLSPSWNAGTR